MKRLLAYVFVVMTLVLAAMACSSRARIIPESKLSQIYAEMFMADEWLREHPGARRTADTTLFYEPIFNKYGYTTKDYIATVDQYMYKPDEFAKVFDETKEILDKKAQETRDLQTLVDGIKAANKSILESYTSKDFTVDSLLWADSSVMWHRIFPTLKLDMFVPDSLAHADSLAVLDSLARVDSLAHADSLAILDSLANKTNQ